MYQKDKLYTILFQPSANYNGMRFSTIPVLNNEMGNVKKEKIII